MSPYNIFLYLPEHRNNRVCYQWLDKVGLAPTGTSPVEKFKCIEWDFPNLALLTQGNLPRGAQLTFAHTAVGNPSLGVPIL